MATLPILSAFDWIPVFRDSEITGFWFAILAALGFSAKAIFVKLAYPYGVSPLALLALRMAFAAPVFAFIALRASRNAAPLKVGDWVALTLLGLLGYYGASLLDFMGLQYISAGLERLILFTYPTLTLLIAVFVFNRSFSARDFAALGLTWLGIALAFAHDLQLRGDLTAVVLGGALVFGSAVCYALYLTGCGEMVLRLGSRRFTALAMCVSTVATFAHFGATSPLQDLVQPMPVLALAAAMAVFSTVLPVFMLSAAIRELGATRTAMLGSVGPIITICLGAVFLDEPLSAAQLAGTVLVVLGVSFASKPAAPKPAPLAPLKRLRV
ncbi:DMT family transporter [Niveibacterium sp. 24ML]|uniref:DMT family transporter n=1 Tax=Niveibacterium sp. 24ML TaxID=2985512 RepID=UPI002271386A|nr:DMT family transporter [Niveibacterium sp. 24ML]MCX9158061.1 DMT family transporter [Niveibacterium sp. 24ML]